MVSGAARSGGNGPVSESRWDAVHHFVPAVYPSDGVGGHVLRSRDAQRRRGRRSEIFVESSHPATSHLTRPWGEYEARRGPGRVVNVYHMATGSPLAEFVAARPEPMILHHHNLTPLELLAPWDPDIIPDLAGARRQLENLAERVDIGVGVSEFNRLELEKLGYSPTAVAPVMIDARLTGHHRGHGRSHPGPPTMLFVGRVAPNKAQHDLIKVVAAARRSSDPAVRNLRLRRVGQDSFPRYRRSLDRLTRSLGVTGAVSFAGTVDDEALAREYAEADVFVCLSRHEGFAMPLLEAMAAGLPVVALDAGAVPETAGGAALVLPRSSPDLVATAVGRVLADRDLARRMIEAGRNRLTALGPDAADSAFEKVLIRLAGGTPDGPPTAVTAGSST